MQLSPYEFGEMLAGFHNAARPAPASADHGVTNMLNQILKETRIMSDAQTQQGRDVAQVVADLAIIKPAFQTMVDKIAALTAAAAASAGTVSPELQEQIDDLHAFAQSVAPTSAPAAPSESAADPAPSEPTATIPPADTTPEPAPTTSAPAETDALTPL